MASYNKVLLMGNLTRDVEVRHTPSNTAVANVGIAVNRKWRDANGEMKEEVTFVDCEAWGKTAENISKFFSKGRPIFIEGRLKLDQWQDKNDGTNRSKLKVVVESFEFVDSKGGGGGGGNGSGAARPIVTTGAKAPAGQAAGGDGGGGNYEPIQEQDIPF